ncbi:hypothetical protein EI546_14320 [Aequorivita sp. H23M31]|uniref:Uncharacterized protein n=1 Tax=Aequorivita ciconiae TaxID=2494375 RepID=A0A410G695_9FLAO|nr:hypothetical protein [Aequorivita sp. H23M31]QAA82818.1 hypothetical protein EI546_14320 [Aequorivita sp. H23M31]
MRKIIFISASFLFMASCTTLKTGTSKTMDIVGPGVIQMPLVADLNVRPAKVSLTKTFTKTSGTSANANTDVVRELLKRENADVLVEPTFESTKTGTKTEITVYGFPATYVNFRPIEEKDLKLIEVTPGLLQKADTHSSIITTSK